MWVENVWKIQNWFTERWHAAKYSKEYHKQFFKIKKIKGGSRCTDTPYYQPRAPDDHVEFDQLPFGEFHSSLLHQSALGRSLWRRSRASCQDTRQTFESWDIAILNFYHWHFVGQSFKQSKFMIAINRLQDERWKYSLPPGPVLFIRLLSGGFKSMGTICFLSFSVKNQQIILQKK